MYSRRNNLQIISLPCIFQDDPPFRNLPTIITDIRGPYRSSAFLALSKATPLPQLANNYHRYPGAAAFLLLVNAMHEVFIRLCIKCKDIAIRLWETKLTRCRSVSESEFATCSKRCTGPC